MGVEEAVGGFLFEEQEGGGKDEAKSSSMPPWSFAR